MSFYFLDGMSFKRAAEEYNIPKTVLWRRVQKRLDILSKVKCRKKGGSRHLGNPKAPEGSQMGERHSEKEVCTKFSLFLVLLF